MTELRRIARTIRHLPGLERADGMWRLVRRPYHRLLNAGGRGTAVMVGRTQLIRIPAEFAGISWETYEPESVTAFVRWINAHPGSLVLDIGSSIGIFSAIALTAGRDMEVIAFDADLSSLAATRRLCQHAGNGELRLVHGLLTCRSATSMQLSEAVGLTESALARSGVRGDIGTTRYLCLTDRDAVDQPQYSVDDLMTPELSTTRRALIKCDVEGAELLVLRGAARLIERSRPAILVSVHPAALAHYGHARSDVEAFLTAFGYGIEVIAIDHEEHWWCEPKADGA